MGILDPPKVRRANQIVVRIRPHKHSVFKSTFSLIQRGEIDILRSIEDLVAEAESQSFSGWDFTYLKGRFDEGKPSWDYSQNVKSAMIGVERMLDIGTGGGEVLASLQPLPSNTYATETWAPNVEVARMALEPLGVRVAEVASEEHVPFESGYFDLVIDRHEEFWPAEVYRILRPGGVFITQQVGGSNTDELNQLLQKKVHGIVAHPNPSWSLAEATSQLRDIGFRIVEGMEETYPSYFNDVGAVVYFLKHAPWEIPDFDTKKYHKHLFELHKRIIREGRLKVTTSRFYMKTLKPA